MVRRRTFFACRGPARSTGISGSIAVPRGRREHQLPLGPAAGVSRRAVSGAGQGSVSGYGRRVRSVLEFLVVALAVTLTPGPGTATVLRVAARDGRRAAMSAVVGNSGGVLMWGGRSPPGGSPPIPPSPIPSHTRRVPGARGLFLSGRRARL